MIIRNVDNVGSIVTHSCKTYYVIDSTIDVCDVVAIHDYSNVNIDEV